ncbi:hypothetical protein ADUPG1_009762, partial [Aduncisulcus paluster]
MSSLKKQIETLSSLPVSTYILHPSFIVPPYCENSPSFDNLIHVFPLSFVPLTTFVDGELSMDLPMSSSSHQSCLIDTSMFWILKSVSSIISNLVFSGCFPYLLDINDFGCFVDGSMKIINSTFIYIDDKAILLPKKDRKKCVKEPISHVSKKSIRFPISPHRLCLLPPELVLLPSSISCIGEYMATWSLGLFILKLLVPSSSEIFSAGVSKYLIWLNSVVKKTFHASSFPFESSIDHLDDDLGKLQEQSHSWTFLDAFPQLQSELSSHSLASLITQSLSIIPSRRPRLKEFIDSISQIYSSISPSYDEICDKILGHIGTIRTNARHSYSTKCEEFSLGKDIHMRKVPTCTEFQHAIHSSSDIRSLSDFPLPSPFNSTSTLFQSLSGTSQSQILRDSVCTYCVPSDDVQSFESEDYPTRSINGTSWVCPVCRAMFCAKCAGTQFICRKCQDNGTSGNNLMDIITFTRRKIEANIEVFKSKRLLMDVVKSEYESCLYSIRVTKEIKEYAYQECLAFVSKLDEHDTIKRKLTEALSHIMGVLHEMMDQNDSSLLSSHSEGAFSLCKPSLIKLCLKNLQTLQATTTEKYKGLEALKLSCDSLFSSLVDHCDAKCRELSSHSQVLRSFIAEFEVFISDFMDVFEHSLKFLHPLGSKSLDIPPSQCKDRSIAFTREHSKACMAVSFHIMEKYTRIREKLLLKWENTAVNNGLVNNNPSFFVDIPFISIKSCQTPLISKDYPKTIQFNPYQALFLPGNGFSKMIPLFDTSSMVDYGQESPFILDIKNSGIYMFVVEGGDSGQNVGSMVRACTRLQRDSKLILLRGG